jgi:glyoxylase-like metal-dependent hydrolase (beta-lactamase superfamily II)
MPLNDTTIDVHFLGRVAYVASEVLVTPAGPVLLDTGPGSTLPALKAGLAELGLGVGDLHAILLSHIHFDHAGATGLLVEENPKLAVYVHEMGAVHLADPAKLIASATRVFGDNMDRFWGKFLPVPSANLRILRGGESLDVGGRRFDVAYTPGHASHHVVYFDPANGTAYTGDCAGIRVPSMPVTLPVTPPPDFSLEAWLATIDRIEAWRPRRLFSTHFGYDDDPVRRLADLRRGLAEWALLARQLLATGESDQVSADRFHQSVLDSLASRAPAEAIKNYSGFADFRASFNGIARYWKKKDAPPR